MNARYYIAAAAIMISCLTGCTEINENIEEQTVQITPQAENDSENYVFSTLSESEREAYEMLAEAARGFEATAAFPVSFDSDAIKKIFTLVYTQENQIFWLDSKFYYSDENGVLNLFYRYDQSDIPSMRAELEVAAGNILGMLPEDCSEYEAVKLFHDEIVRRCTFSKEGEYVNTAYGAIVDGFAQCEGYAFAMSYLCSKLGIGNYVVTGTNIDGASHAWNKIHIDGAWYNVDCTWDDPIFTYDNPKYLRHDYMLVADSDIIGITHIQNENYFTPLPCNSVEGNYFIKENLLFTTADEGIASLEKQFRSIALSDEINAEIRFDNTEAYNTAEARLFDNGELKDIIEKLNGRYGLKIKSANKTDNDSMYIIHISLVYENEV